MIRFFDVYHDMLNMSFSHTNPLISFAILLRFKNVLHFHWSADNQIEK